MSSTNQGSDAGRINGWDLQMTRPEIHRHRRHRHHRRPATATAATATAATAPPPPPPPPPPAPIKCRVPNVIGLRLSTPADGSRPGTAVSARPTRAFKTSRTGDLPTSARRESYVAAGHRVSSPSAVGSSRDHLVTGRLPRRHRRPEMGFHHCRPAHHAAHHRPIVPSITEWSALYSSRARATLR